MKWYFASRVKHQNYLRDIAEKLKVKGEQVNSHWIYGGSLKPYEQNLDKVQNLASEVVTAIACSDIFILISDSEGTDMFVELGIALAVPKMRIYIVGEYGKRSLMQLHPRIVHADSLEEVFVIESLEVEK